MTRAGGGWIPDGRAKAIRADCEASLAALDGLPIDLYLIHAPDPRTPWRTSVRALARLVDEGLVRRVGLANVNRRQLDEALELAPIAAVQVALSPYDDTRAPRRSRRPLRRGGNRRDRPLSARRAAPRGSASPVSQALADVADARGATAAEVALAWLLSSPPWWSRSPALGARRPRAPPRAQRRSSSTPTTERALAARSARRVRLAAQRPRRRGRRGRRRRHGHPRRREEPCRRGIRRPWLPPPQPRRARRILARARRRTRRGAVLRRSPGRPRQHVSHARSAKLRDRDGEPTSSPGAVHLARYAARAGAGQRRRAAARPLRRAPDSRGAAALARREPGVLAPTSQMRALRELEPPSTDEGWTTVEQVPFTRTPSSRSAVGRLRRGRRVEAARAGSARSMRAIRGAPHLVFDWSADGSPGDLAEVADPLATAISGPVESALCPHGGGPPICWCRPPLPGLPLAFARAHDADPSRSTARGDRRPRIGRSRPRSARASFPSEPFRRTRAPCTPRRKGSWPARGTDPRQACRSRPGVPRRIPTAAASCALLGTRACRSARGRSAR